jgi:hypothetical protein
MILRTAFLPLTGALAGLLAAATVTLNPPAAQAQNYWVNPSAGLWHVGDNWSEGVPENWSDPEINNGGSAQVDFTSYAICDYLFLGKNTQHSGNLVISGSELTVNREYVGHYGQGSALQTGGTHTVNVELTLAFGTDANGTYELVDGTLDVSRACLGRYGSGSFTQQGGTFDVENYVFLREGGLPEASTEYVMSGGDLTASTIELHHLEGSGCGRFIQSGGTVTTNLLDIQNPVGCDTSYELSGGELTVNGTEYIADVTEGSFRQTGGTHTVNGTLEMGCRSPSHYPDAQATYDLEDGTLNVSGSEYVGYESRDNYFTQTGGMHTVDGTLFVGYLYSGGGGPRGIGRYYLNGGHLEVHNLRLAHASAYGIFDIGDPDAELYVSGELSTKTLGWYSAVPGTQIHFSGTLVNLIGWLDPYRFPGFGNTELICEGGDGHVAQLEVACTDYGPKMMGFYDNEKNFAWAGLTLGGDDVGQLQLIDNEHGPADVLYVYTLTAGPGSLLDLNGITLYYVVGNIDPDATIINGTPIPIIPGDIDGDGDVDQSDLGVLLADWNCTGGGCPGDIDGDGDTDQSDLGILLAHWGEGCP